MKKKENTSKEKSWWGPSAGGGSAQVMIPLIGEGEKVKEIR